MKFEICCNCKRGCCRGCGMYKKTKTVIYACFDSCSKPRAL